MTMDDVLEPDCRHLDEIVVVAPEDAACAACIAEGSHWVHLRMCLICGVVGCCDNSPRQHMSAHNAETGHKLIRSIEPSEQWVWCYEDEAFLEDVPAIEPVDRG